MQRTRVVSGKTRCYGARRVDPAELAQSDDARHLAWFAHLALGKQPRVLAERTQRAQWLTRAQ
jgi:hypothetical protein